MILWIYDLNKIHEEQRDLEQLNGLGGFSFAAWSQLQIQGLEAKHKYYQTKNTVQTWVIGIKNHGNKFPFLSAGSFWKGRECFKGELFQNLITCPVK